MAKKASSKKKGRKAKGNGEQARAKAVREIDARLAAESAPAAQTDAEATPPEGEAKPKARKKAERKDGTMSGLDAAAKVLSEAKDPLNCKDLVDLALENGYWKTNGKTPQATLYAAISREIARKGDAARFRKADRGKFTIAK